MMCDYSFKAAKLHFFPKYPFKDMRNIETGIFYRIPSGIFRPVEKSDAIPVAFRMECNPVCLSFGYPAIQS
jgi:hypothetical protein